MDGPGAEPGPAGKQGIRWLPGAATNQATDTHHGPGHAGDSPCPGNPPQLTQTPRRGRGHTLEGVPVSHGLFEPHIPAQRTPAELAAEIADDAIRQVAEERAEKQAARAQMRQSTARTRGFVRQYTRARRGGAR